MGNNIKVLFIVSALFLSACASYVPDRVISNFTYCYDSTINYSNSKIKLNGYYLRKEHYVRSIYDKNTGSVIDQIQDTFYNSVIFFKDGVFITEFGGGKCSSCNEELSSGRLRDVAKNKHPETISFYNGSVCGLYRIEGDTIKTQSVNHQTQLNPYWYLLEKWYIIVDSNTIVQCYTKNLIDERGGFSNPNKRLPYRFIETNIELPSDIWLKKQDWFWCDKKNHGK